ncbi:MAG: hypothetical protein ABMA64_19355 [Myxococcota bacterium]
MIWLWLHRASFGVDVKVVESASPPAAAVIHFVSPDGQAREVGLVRATDTSRAGNAVIVEKIYEDLCTTPCTLEMPVGWHEFRFSLGKREWVKKLEVRPEEQTIELKRKSDNAMMMTGIILTCYIVTAPIGIPLWVAGTPVHHRVE